MLAAAKGILPIWQDVAEGAKREIFDWYDREHHLERTAINGFLSAQRYVSVDGHSPLIFNRYETSNLDVFKSSIGPQSRVSVRPDGGVTSASLP